MWDGDWMGGKFKDLDFVALENWDEIGSKGRFGVVVGMAYGID